MRRTQYFNYDYVRNLIPKVDFDYHINHVSHNLYDIIEQENYRVRIIIYEVDKETIELTKNVKNIYHKLFHISHSVNSKELSLLNKFEKTLQKLEKEKFIDEKLEDWEFDEVTDTTLSFLHPIKEYSCDRENNCIILRTITFDRYYCTHY